MPFAAFLFSLPLPSLEEEEGGEEEEDDEEEGGGGGEGGEGEEDRYSRFVSAWHWSDWRM